MNEFKTRPVGSVFHHKKHGLLQVVESCSCDDCVFNVSPIAQCLADDTVGYCSYNNREDEKSVIFKQYKKMTDKIADNDDETFFGKALYASTKNPLREVIYDKENPIGEPFFTKKYGLLVAVEAKEGDDCEKCAIYNTKKKKCGAATINIGSCSPHYREDGKEVIFKHIEDVKEGEV